MIAVEQARAHLEQLGLVEAAAVLDARLEAAAQKQVPYADFLADLLTVEAAARRARYLVTRTRLAHLPFQRTLDQFDFAFQPSVDERLAVHPRTTRPGQRLTVPGQWAGLAAASDRPVREPLAVEVPSIEVERRSLTVYDALVTTGGGR